MLNKLFSIALSLLVVSNSVLIAAPVWAQENVSAPLETSSSSQTSSESPQSSSDSSSEPNGTDEVDTSQRRDNVINSGGQSEEGNEESSEDSSIETDEATPVEPPANPVSGLPQLHSEPKRFTLEDEEVINQNFVNLLSGSAEIRLPIQVPNGIRGLSPDLTLEYSSQSVHQNSAFGYGWRMQLGEIKRLNKNGIDKMYSDPTYHVELGNLQGELIYIDEVNGVESYRLRKEQNFAEFEYYTADKYWEVTTNQGMKYFLGNSTSARLESLDGSKIATWYVETIEDVMGHQVQYQYQISGNNTYPSSIAYGDAAGGNNHPFRILFESTARDDYRSDYGTGFLVDYTQLISSIRIEVEGSERLRYDLKYLNPTLKSRKDLKSIMLMGTNNNETVDQEITLKYYSKDDGYTDATYHRNNFLRAIIFPKGGTISYDYKPSTQFFNDLGELANQSPHYPLFVVNSVTRSDHTGRNDVSNYFYSDGYFFFESVVERELAGFGRVTVTDPLGYQSKYYFHQGGGFDGSSLGEAPDSWALIGQQYRQERFDDNGNMLSRSISTWKAELLSPKRYFIAQESMTESLFNEAGDVSSTGSEYLYDSSTGNVLKQTELGEVTANDDGTFVDLLEDARSVEYDYAINGAKNLISFPAQQELFDFHGTILSRTQFRYDDLQDGRVRYGNLTNELHHFFDEARDLETVTVFNTNGQPISVTDPLGNTSTVTYDSLGLYPASVTNALGHTTTMTYDPMYGQVTRMTTPNNLIVQTSFDGLGRMIEQQMSDPNNGNQLVTMQSVEYAETSFPHAVKTSVHLDDTTIAHNWQYLDGFGRSIQSRTQDSGGDQYVVINTEYDALGRSVVQTLPVFATGAAFDLADASSISTTTTYDALSRPLSVTDANGTTGFSYDRWTTTVTDALGNQKSTRSDALGRLVEVIEQPGSLDYVTQYDYDARDLLVKITNANGNERSFDYDSLGRMIEQEDLHAPGDSDVGTRSYRFDDNGNVLSVTKADGQVVSSSYDELNRVLSQTGPGMDYQYRYDQGSNAIGQLSSVTSADFSWQANYDRRGRVTQEQVTLNTDQGAEVFSKDYSYTRFDQPETVSFPDATTISYQYNGIGQIESINSSAGGIITHLNYSPLSQVEGVSYGNGLRSVMTYDPQQMYRMTSKRTEPAALPVSFEPLSPGISIKTHLQQLVSTHTLLPTTFAQEPLPQLFDYTDSEEPTVVEDFEIPIPGVTIPLENTDSDEGSNSGGSSGPSLTGRRRDPVIMQNPLRDERGGEITTPTVLHSGPTDSNFSNQVYFQAQYNSTMSTPSPAVKYQVKIRQNTQIIWDSGMVDLPQPINPGEATPMIAADLSNAVDGDASWTIAFELQDGVQSPWSLEEPFMVNLTPTAPPVTDLQHISYQYDAVGNITQLEEQSGTAATKTAVYTYDELYRLTDTSVTNTTVGQDYTRSLSYGPTGNILSKSDVGSYSYAQTGFMNPQAVTSISDGQGGSWSFDYDENGNLIREEHQRADGSSTLKTLSWDVLDRILSIEVTEGGTTSTVSFVYDHTGRRLIKTISKGSDQSSTLYPFGDYEVTTEESTKVSVSANNMHLATISTPESSAAESPRIIFSHTDHLGGGNILTDSNGDQVQTLDYYPFGSIRVDEQYQNFDETKKFTSHEFDDDTGYYYAQARYYQPEIGRFVSQDPLGWRPGELMGRFAEVPQAFNLYSYAANNPVILVDPTGEVVSIAAVGIGLLVAVAVELLTLTPEAAYAPDTGEIESLISNFEGQSISDASIHDFANFLGNEGYADLATAVFFIGEIIDVAEDIHGLRKGEFPDSLTKKPRTKKLQPDPSATGEHSMSLETPEGRKFTTFDSDGFKECRGCPNSGHGVEGPHVHIYDDPNVAPDGTAYQGGEKKVISNEEYKKELGEEN